MFATSPEHAVEMMDKAFNNGDLNSLLNFYENLAVVVTEPGKLARGKDEFRRFFEKAMASRPSVCQIRTHVIEADDIALFLSRWTLTDSSGEASTKQFVATTVFRKQLNGEWKALIDNSLGPLVLGPE